MSSSPQRHEVARAPVDVTADACNDRGSDVSSGGGGSRVSGSSPPPPPSASMALKKKNKSLSARALRLFKSSLRRSTSSARTVLTATPSCGDASSCGGFDDASASFRLGGVGSALGSSSFYARESNDATENQDDYSGSEGGAISHDRSTDSEEEETGPTDDPEAVGRARALHVRGRRAHAEGRYGEAAARHSEALEEMGGAEALVEAAVSDEHGCCGSGTEDVLRARIAHDLARARYSLAAAAGYPAMASNVGEDDLRRLADEARSASRTMHRTMASHLELQAKSFCRSFDGTTESEAAEAENSGSGELFVKDLSDSAIKADLLRAAGRIRDERLFEYDSALRCYEAALSLEVQAIEDIDGRISSRRRGRSQVAKNPPKAPDRMMAAKKTLEARAEETRHMIGRIHYKRGQFGMAVRASLG